MSEAGSHPYDTLTPDTILISLESLGLRPDGGILALNSYENRVYQVGIEDAQPMVAKFYRPDRWSDASILEEHQFSIALAADEIPVVPPLEFGGETLHCHDGFRFSLFPRQGGRWPELEDPDNLEWIGRFLGRIHQIGKATTFKHRLDIDVETLGHEPVNYLLDNDFIPVEQELTYRQLSAQLLEIIAEQFDKTPYRMIRLHGDCHPGNILWTEGGPHFVDMDDCRNGPAIQDLWMLLSGDRNEMALQLSYLREGYETFCELNPAEVSLIEPLRTLRMIHYAAWLARRWNDPAFPAAFPWFNTPQYWQEHLTNLNHQLMQLKLSPLPLY